MDLNNEVFDWIERYLTDEMSHEEKTHFENLAKNDPSLQKKVERQREFTGFLIDYGKREGFIKSLDRLHAEFPKDQLTELVQLYTPQPTKLVRLWKKHRVGLAVAASVVILAISANLYYINNHKINKQTVQVSALKRDVENIRKNQHAILANAKTKHGPLTEGKYGATSFLIDKRGYLVTNYHVIEGADSVFVQNDKGSVFNSVVVFKSKNYDLAILKINDSSFHAPSSIPYAFSKGSPDLGDPVFTLGYPRDEIVYNEGYLSSSTGFEGDSISYQVSIPVNPGNSGGPVFDAKGNVLGIISSKETQADGVAFATRTGYLLSAIRENESDSVVNKIRVPEKINGRNTLKNLSRVNQVRKLRDYIYMVKTYN